MIVCLIVSSKFRPLFWSSSNYEDYVLCWCLGWRVDTANQVLHRTAYSIVVNNMMCEKLFSTDTPAPLVATPSFTSMPSCTGGGFALFASVMTESGHCCINQ